MKTLLVAAILAAVLVHIMPDEQAMEAGRSTVRVESVQVVAPVRVSAPARAV